MQPVVPVGRSREDSTPSVVGPPPPPGGPIGWAHTHASMIAVLVLIVFALAAIALWRTNRGPAPVFVDDNDLEVLEKT